MTKRRAARKAATRWAEADKQLTAGDIADTAGTELSLGPKIFALQDNKPITTSHATFTKLPFELTLKICTYLSGRDIKCLRLTCKVLSQAELDIRRVFISADKRVLEIFRQIAENPRIARRIEEIIWDDTLWVPRSTEGCKDTFVVYSEFASACFDQFPVSDRSNFTTAEYDMALKSLEEFCPKEKKAGKLQKWERPTTSSPQPLSGADVEKLWEMSPHLWSDAARGTVDGEVFRFRGPKYCAAFRRMFDALGFSKAIKTFEDMMIEQQSMLSTDTFHTEDALHKEFKSGMKSFSNVKSIKTTGNLWGDNVLDYPLHHLLPVDFLYLPGCRRKYADTWGNEAIVPSLAETSSPVTHLSIDVSSHALSRCRCTYDTNQRIFNLRGLKNFLELSLRIDRYHAMDTDRLRQALTRSPKLEKFAISIKFREGGERVGWGVNRNERSALMILPRGYHWPCLRHLVLENVEIGGHLDVCAFFRQLAPTLQRIEFINVELGHPGSYMSMLNALLKQTPFAEWKQKPRFQITLQLKTCNRNCLMLEEEIDAFLQGGANPFEGSLCAENRTWPRTDSGWLRENTIQDGFGTMVRYPDSETPFLDEKYQKVEDTRPLTR